MTDELKGLATALAKAQREIALAEKDSENPLFHSRYASLASVWSACREPLTKNGLSVVQLPGRFADGCVEVTTMLLHESGQRIESTMSTPVPPAKNKKGETIAAADPQIVGSAVTYLRRFALAAMVGVAPNDDDSRASVDHGKQRRQTQANTPPSHVNEKGEVILPGEAKKWEGNGGKPLTEVSTTVLTYAHNWFQKNSGDKVLLEAIEDVIESRKKDDGTERQPEDPSDTT